MKNFLLDGIWPEVGRLVRFHHPWLGDGEVVLVVETWKELDGQHMRQKVRGIAIDRDNIDVTHDLLGTNWEYEDERGISERP